MRNRVFQEPLVPRARPSWHRGRSRRLSRREWAVSGGLMDSVLDAGATVVFLSKTSASVRLFRVYRNENFLEG